MIMLAIVSNLKTVFLSCHGAIMKREASNLCLGGHYHNVPLRSLDTKAITVDWDYIFGKAIIKYYFKVITFESFSCMMKQISNMGIIIDKH